MSIKEYEESKEETLNEVTSMTIDEFQTACEDYNIEGVTMIDEMINDLIQAKMEILGELSE